MIVAEMMPRWSLLALGGRSPQIRALVRDQGSVQLHMIGGQGSQRILEPPS